MFSPHPRTLSALAVVALLLLPLVPTAPATSVTPLVANAGDSQTGAVGTSLTMTGSATGGTAPYTYSWTYLGASDRFSAPTSAKADFSTTSLAPGVHNLTLTVTDSTGATASDVVKVGVNPAGVISFQGNVLLGVPDEILLSGWADGGTRTHPFTVPTGTSAFTATLDWLAARDDFDLRVLDPSGNEVQANVGATAAKPERITVPSPAAGTWTLVVEAYTVALGSYTLTVTGLPGAGAVIPNPGIYHGGGGVGLNPGDNLYLFGSTDTQLLLAHHTTDVTTFQWDLDGDGEYDDGTGNPLIANFTPGATYPIGIRGLNAEGLRETQTTRVRVYDTAAHLRILRCNGGPQNAMADMETSVFSPTCWGHIGHNTYYLGETPWTLAHAYARATQTEQPYSPPKDLTLSLTSTTVFEASLDSLTWFPLGSAVYTFRLGDPASRQIVVANLAANDNPFRFVRVFSPPSQAEGLSGFLDASLWELGLNPATTNGSGRAPSAATLTCAEDLMERFFEDHPCWFGGINRYDSPSALHTYYLGGEAVRLTGIKVNVTTAPWRLDDLAQFEPDRTGADVILESSLDGLTFTPLATFRTEFTDPANHTVALESHVNATFLRLRTEYSDLYDQSLNSANLAPQRHLKGFLLSSGLEIAGTLPASLGS